MWHLVTVFLNKCVLERSSEIQFYSFISLNRLSDIFLNDNNSKVLFYFLNSYENVSIESSGDMMQMQLLLQNKYIAHCFKNVSLIDTELYTHQKCI